MVALAPPHPKLVSATAAIDCTVETRLHKSPPNAAASPDTFAAVVACPRA